MPKLPFFFRESIRLPPNIQKEAEAGCPECGKPCVHIQPRVNDFDDKMRPTYAYRCKAYHEWAFINGQQILRVVNNTENWASHE
jgi:hypothetical protein